MPMLVFKIETRFLLGSTHAWRMAKLAYVKFLQSDKSAACNSAEFIVLRSKTVCPQYDYLIARSNGFRENAIKSISAAPAT